MIENNLIKSIEFVSFNSLVNLTFLSMNHNRIYFIQNLSSLAVLNLDNNQITEIYSYTFYGLKKLKKLTYNLIIQLLK